MCIRDRDTASQLKVAEELVIFDVVGQVGVLQARVTDNPASEDIDVYKRQILGGNRCRLEENHNSESDNDQYVLKILHHFTWFMV